MLCLACSATPPDYRHQGVAKRIDYWKLAFNWPNFRICGQLHVQQAGNRDAVVHVQDPDPRDGTLAHGTGLGGGLEGQVRPGDAGLSSRARIGGIDLSVVDWDSHPNDSRNWLSATQSI